MSKLLLVVDYGAGNIRSIEKLLLQVGGSDILILDKPPTENVRVDGVVLPGVGSFAFGMNSLKSSGFDLWLRTMALERRIPILGICLGMHFLADRGSEGGTWVNGLGLVAGEVQKLMPVFENERVPHMGWNSLQPVEDCSLLSGISSLADFYFAHSYHFVPYSDEHVMAITNHCGGFVSVVQSANIFGVQFHPEKSSRPGRRLVENFLSITRA